MNRYLGIDGGGTKTATCIIDPAGTELGRGTAGPGNIATHDDAALASAIQHAVTQACQQAGLPADNARFAAVCAGVAGYSVEERRAAFEHLLRTLVAADIYRVEPDYVIAYWGASHGEPGIIVIAGTGAVSFGRNAAGHTCKEDGLGYLLGDRGSGFNLGLRVLRHTLERMQEGLTDPLAEAIQEHTGARTQNAILQWLYGNFSPARVAALAPLVGQLAEQGEPHARKHLTEMARRLRHAVRQVRHRLWLPRDTPVYPLGGLWHISAFLREEFQEPRWTGEGPIRIEPEELPGGRFHIVNPRNDPAYGAALLALRTHRQNLLGEPPA
ncbi:MAG: BadF/BadG/BcrA/BcrD ATPase family protein [Chloroherpetonaceae bacterium]|nr:hypothetical protein [Chthonomonadaceae bacterium]MDW8209285.1 BadF/BadG/BcrA/BcrD ATPase family protein [Chloroherpetonaceae bacterium]